MLPYHFPYFHLTLISILSFLEYYLCLSSPHTLHFIVIDNVGLFWWYNGPFASWMPYMCHTMPPPNSCSKGKLIQVYTQINLTLPHWYYSNSIDIVVPFCIALFFDYVYLALQCLASSSWYIIIRYMFILCEPSLLYCSCQSDPLSILLWHMMFLYNFFHLKVCLLLVSLSFDESLQENFRH